jgi:hypothetical protein
MDFRMASWPGGGFGNAAMADGRQEESKIAGMAGLREGWCVVADDSDFAMSKPCA